MCKRYAIIALFLWLAIASFASPKDPDIKALLDAGHLKQARTLLDARLLKNPKDAEALYGQSRIKSALNDLEGAISYAEQASAADPNNAQYHARLGEVYGDKAQKVSMFSAMKFAHKIRDEGEKAVQLDPKCSDGYELLIQYYLQAPGIAGGDKNKAYKMLDELFKFNPERANLIRGELADKDKQTDKADEYYKNAALANPSSFRAQTNLGNRYFAKKQYDQVEKIGRQLIAVDRGRSTGYQFLAITYAQQERWPELESILAEAEKNVPDNLNSYYQTGRVLWGNGKDLPRAEKYFKKYLSQDPEINAPTLAHAHWRLGLVYEKEGRKPEAVQELETALKMKPDLEDAKKDLKRLK